VLRLNPVVAMNWRQAERDTLLPRGGGPDESEPILVPKGTNVHFPQYVIHRLKKFWGEDANEFRPERWEEGHPHPWEYIPFNGGPRICIGQQFSQTEAAYVLVRILQNVKDLTVKRHRPDSDEPNVWIQLLASIEKCEVHFELTDEADITDHVARGVTEHPDKVRADFQAFEKRTGKVE
jgi:cytochrome P450